MNTPQKFEVVVLGAGITGSSLSYHLSKRGVEKLALIHDPGSVPETSGTMGLISGGQVDNFTRIGHTFGFKFAKAFWRFSDDAFDALVGFARANSIQVSTCRRLRLLVSDHELKEGFAAVNQLQKAGFESHFLEKKDFGQYGESLKPRTLGIQDDGARGGFCDVAELCAKLRGLSKATEISKRALNLKSVAKGIEIELADGTKIHSEVVILATHLACATFLPTIKDAFVSIAEQWIDIAAPAMHDTFWANQGVVFSANHGYEFGVSTGAKALNFSGGRFLRHHAGIGFTPPLHVDEKITAFLLKQLGETFSWGQSALGGKASVGFECRPCDELPLIGPMFGDDRILLATGYMGSGLTTGFYAGDCIAKLVDTGRCDELPGLLWPRRLRSIRQND